MIAADVMLPPMPELVVARAQAASAQTDTARFVQAQLAALDAQFRSAVQTQDFARLGSLIADAFISTDQSGIVDTKKTFLARTAAGLRFERLSQSVQVDGDTVIVTGAEHEVRGATRERILFTRVWKRTAQSWQLLSNTQFRDPRPAAVPGMASVPPVTQPGRAYTMTAVSPGGERLSTTATAMPLPPNVVRVGGDIKEPKKILHVPPIYPAIAKEARVSGVVILEAVIDESGSVANIRVLRGHPQLDPAAVDAVAQWKYVPTMLNGIPVPVIMTVTVNFQLADPPSTVVP
jgi:TonB family protein